VAREFHARAQAFPLRAEGRALQVLRVELERAWRRGLDMIGDGADVGHVALELHERVLDQARLLERVGRFVELRPVGPVGVGRADDREALAARPDLRRGDRHQLPLAPPVPHTFGQPGTGWSADL